MNIQHHVKAVPIVFACLILVLILSGCGAPATPEALDGAAGAAVAPTMIMVAEATQAPAPEAGDRAAQPVEGTPDLVAALPQDRMIVKNGEIDLLVESTNTAIDQVTQIATDNGGYVLTSQSSLTGVAKSAIITIAVRSDQFETAMRRLRQIAIEVQRETSSGQDVSSEYVDLESRLRNLEATRDRIKSFLDQAKTVDEALKINQQLSDIEAEIEQVKGRMTYLSGRSAFSTITITVQEKIDATPTLTPTITPTPTSTPPWSLSPVIEDATSAQVSLFHGVVTLATWLIIVPGPYCLAGGLILWGIWAFNRRRKSGQRPAPPAPPEDES
jgi:hypothetical protein